MHDADSLVQLQMYVSVWEPSKQNAALLMSNPGEAEVGCLELCHSDTQDLSR